MILNGEFSRVVLMDLRAAGSERVGEAETPVLELASRLVLDDGVGGNSMRDLTLLARAVKRRTRWRTWSRTSELRLERNLREFIVKFG